MRRAVIPALIIATYGCGSTAQTETAPEQVVEDPFVKMDARAREAVLYHLKDGESARFRNVRRIPLGNSSDETNSFRTFHYCGEVNAKNAFGAYAGFVTFVVTTSLGSDRDLSDSAQISNPSDPLTPGTNILYMSFCEENGEPVSGEAVDFSTMNG